MSTQATNSQLVARRGELMVELFLQELEPEFISRPTTADLGYDLLFGFLNKKGGVNTFAAEIKATERPPAGRLQIMRRAFERFAHSNIPGLLFVADVKQNKLFYAWLNAKKLSGTFNVSIPIIELDEASKTELKKQLRASDLGVSAVG